MQGIVIVLIGVALVAMLIGTILMDAKSSTDKHRNLTDAEIWIMLKGIKEEDRE